MGRLRNKNRGGRGQGELEELFVAGEVGRDPILRGLLNQDT